jgi:hypothetical protein
MIVIVSRCKFLTCSRSPLTASRALSKEWQSLCLGWSLRNFHYHHSTTKYGNHHVRTSNCCQLLAMAGHPALIVRWRDEPYVTHFPYIPSDAYRVFSLFVESALEDGWVFSEFFTMKQKARVKCLTNMGNTQSAIRNGCPEQGH